MMGDIWSYVVSSALTTLAGFVTWVVVLYAALVLIRWIAEELGR